MTKGVKQDTRMEAVRERLLEEMTSSVLEE